MKSKRKRKAKNTKSPHIVDILSLNCPVIGKYSKQEIGICSRVSKSQCENLIFDLQEKLLKASMYDIKALARCRGLLDCGTKKEVCERIVKWERERAT